MRLVIDTTKGHGIRKNEVRLAFTASFMRFAIALPSELAGEIGYSIVHAANLIDKADKLNGEVVQEFTLVKPDMAEYGE